MREILKYAAANRITNTKNLIIKKSLENKLHEDKTIKIITKEVASYISRLIKIND
jgi:hypothetical protein